MLEPLSDDEDPEEPLLALGARPAPEESEDPPEPPDPLEPADSPGVEGPAESEELCALALPDPVLDFEDALAASRLSFL